MKKISQILAVMLAILVMNSVSADEAAVMKALSQSMPRAKIDSIKPTEIKGLYEVVTGANIIYASEDGHYLLQGQLYDAVEKKNITEDKLATVRNNALNEVGENNMIIFKPDNSKHFVSVFTDIDCGYCRKLHSEISKYMDEGITIRYLFFPRAGKGSESYSKAISVWCAENRQEALTDAKKGKSLDTKECDNPVDKHMELGEAFGMTGTPMIVTEKGNMLPGYVPAAQLAKILNNE